MKKNKLIELQKEYIELLEKSYNETFQIAFIHHYNPPDHDVKRGELLRKEISKLTN